MTPKKPIPAPAMPEPTDAPMPDASTPAPAAPARKMMKSEAMDKAIAAGADMPVEGVAYVKKHFGLDVSTKQFSTHKSLAKQKKNIDARHKAAKPVPPTPKPSEPAKPSALAKLAAPAKPAPPKTAVAKPAAVKPALAPKLPAPAQPTTSKPSPADLARTLKALVADHGAGAVADMLAVFVG